MKPPAIIAKCGKYKQWECQTKYRDIPECKNCTLVNHHFIPVYIYINGTKYKRCPKCKQYYKIEKFAKNNGGYNRLCSSWCKNCNNQYNKNKTK